MACLICPVEVELMQVSYLKVGVVAVVLFPNKLIIVCHVQDAGNENKHKNIHRSVSVTY